MFTEHNMYTTRIAVSRKRKIGSITKNAGFPVVYIFFGVYCTWRAINHKPDNEITYASTQQHKLIFTYLGMPHAKRSSFYMSQWFLCDEINFYKRMQFTSTFTHYSGAGAARRSRTDTLMNQGNFSFRIKYFRMEFFIRFVCVISCNSKLTKWKIRFLPFYTPGWLTSCGCDSCWNCLMCIVCCWKSSVYSCFSCENLII